jgi:hypothetical protein
MTDVEVPPFWRMVVNEALKPFFAFQVCLNIRIFEYVHILERRIVWMLDTDFNLVLCI